MRRIRRELGPNQLVLWTRRQLIRLMTLARPDTPTTRPRSGRLQAVARRVVARIRENCRELFGLVRDGFQMGVLGGMFLGRKITQIYEGTNQIQRLVMARSLLKG